LIDLHSHILPDIDDGARSMDMSLDMARQAVENGITHMVCTPHIHAGYFDNTFKAIEQAYILLKARLDSEQIPLQLSFGAEVRVSEQIPSWILHNEIPFIGKFASRKVLLLEMPHSHVPVGIEMLIKWLLENNIQPLIAHPERNRELLADNGKFEWLRRTNVIFQLTAGALVGRFGAKVNEFALKLIQERKIQVVASDTHNLTKRPNDMAKAYEVVAMLNEDYAKEVFYSRPASIVIRSDNIY
jgi:protein-tyrosine phosphatase